MEGSKISSTEVKILVVGRERKRWVEISTSYRQTDELDRGSTNIF